jgi:hypothetical protein
MSVYDTYIPKVQYEAGKENGRESYEPANGSLMRIMAVIWAMRAGSDSSQVELQEFCLFVRPFGCLFVCSVCCVSRSQHESGVIRYR